jgi:hypothetical protein
MNKKISIFFVSLALVSSNTVFATYGIQTKTSNCVANQTLPDFACSPGAVLTTDTKIICKTGYTKTVRNVTEATKKKVFKEYSIPYSLRGNYEVDHIISLELGGSNDISNLYPESYTIKDNARIKDKFENYLHKQVCSGKMDIVEAQKQISSDWLTYYQTEMLGFKVNTITKPTPKSTEIITPIIPVKVITPTQAIIKQPEVTTVIVPEVVVKQSVLIPVEVTSPTDPEVKKSKTDICHARVLLITVGRRTILHIPQSRIVLIVEEGYQNKVKTNPHQHNSSNE